MKRVLARCPGSCGELIQGWLGDSEKLVTYGVNAYATAIVQSQEETIDVQRDKEKSFLALKKTLQLLDIPLEKAKQLSLTLQSEVPVAKGMASSTADIAATCLAVAAFFHQTISLHDILTICLSIEATDSTPFSSLTLFDQQKGRTIERSGWCPEFYVLTLEPEEEVITEQFRTENTTDLFFQQRIDFEKVYNLYAQAVQEQSLEKLGQAAFESACLNQALLVKPYFNEFASMIEPYRLVGINVAHSGTVVGLMCDGQTDIQGVYKALNRADVRAAYPIVRLRKTCYKGVHLVNDCHF